MEEHLIELSFLILHLFIVGLSDLSKFLSTSFYGCIFQGISDEIPIFSNFRLQKTKNFSRITNHSMKSLSVDRALRLQETLITRQNNIPNLNQFSITTKERAQCKQAQKKVWEEIFPGRVLINKTMLSQVVKKFESNFQ